MIVARTALKPSVNARSPDPDAPLDDLAGLRGIVGDARVVAIGESAHYVPEFHLVRHRLLRFLAERLGFSAYALEAPFTAGRAIGDWIESGSGDIGAIAATAMPIRLGRVPELHDTLRWMRANGGLRFVGTDVPGSGGSIVPALERVRSAFEGVDAEALPLIDRAIGLARGHHHAATFPVLARYATVPAGEQDELTAVLSRLLSRAETMVRHLAARGGDAADALLDLRGAWYADHLHRDFAGRAFAAAAASRDAFMAEVVLDRLERNPEERMVVASHNVHIQKLPSAGGPRGQLPQGFHLAAALGDDYRAIAITAPAGRTAQIQPNPVADEGFGILEVELEPPADDSLDALLSGDAPLAVADLRGAPVDGIHRMRMEGYFLELPVVDAFDAVAWVPRSTVSPAVSGSTG